MSYFRSYFEKNNTLIKNSQTNTAKSPTTEISYGASFSKFIFKIDFTDLKAKIDNGDFVVDANTKHTLHLTNTIFGQDGFLGEETNNAKERATSFDLILFQIPTNEYWDEGIGFDYVYNSYDFVSGNRTFDERPSNWYNRTTLNSWTTTGVYNDEPTILKTIHFDNGNEDINVDITEYVNNILNGGADQGVGIAFAPVYSFLTPIIDQSVAFFTKYTQTFFEPFVESYFDDRINDNRTAFIGEGEQNLYLYVNNNGNSYNLDNLPTVNIYDSNNNIVNNLSNIQTTQIRKGVYKVSFTLLGTICDGKRFFYDVWDNLSINGNSLAPVRQKFIPLPFTSGFSIGENKTETNRYAVQYSGIKQGEKMKSGEKRKVTINFRTITDTKNHVLDEVYYRIYINEGANTQVMVHDWTLVDKTNENSFFLDTSYFIPREYYMELKGMNNNEVFMYKEVIKFTIVSEK